MKNKLFRIERVHKLRYYLNLNDVTFFIGKNLRSDSYDLKLTKENILYLIPIEIGHNHRYFICKIKMINNQSVLITCIMNSVVRYLLIFSIIILVISVPILLYLSSFFSIKIWMICIIPILFLLQCVIIILNFRFKVEELNRKLNVILNKYETVTKK